MTIARPVAARPQLVVPVVAHHHLAVHPVQALEHPRERQARLVETTLQEQQVSRGPVKVTSLGKES